MKLCFYSPYIPDHFGGGEKHLFDVASVAAKSHQVSIAISSKTSTASLTDIKKSYEKFFGRALEKMEFVHTPIGTSHSFIKKLDWTKQFDGLYYVTDGSLFFSAAKNNFLHIQTPLQLKKSSPIEILKLRNWQHKNTNSEFTKQLIEKWWNVTITEVLYPMVDLSEFKDQVGKKKIILSVGRFFTHQHSKRQDILIEMFKKLIHTNPQEMKGWTLQLAGSVEDASYVAKLRKMAAGLPIEILTDISRSQLLHLYQTASIFWHAAGFGIDEDEHPEKVGHFGISTVEAMAAGVLPLVHYKGGQIEVLGSALKELGWQTTQECSDKTLELMGNELKQRSLHAKLLKQAQVFSKPQFEERIEKMFDV